MFLECLAWQGHDHCPDAREATGTERAKVPALLKPTVQGISLKSLKGFPRGLATPSMQLRGGSERLHSPSTSPCREWQIKDTNPGLVKCTTHTTCPAHPEVWQGKRHMAGKVRAELAARCNGETHF